MADDLIERLKRFAHSDDGCASYNADGPLVMEAIAEIERLRKELDTLKTIHQDTMDYYPHRSD